MFVTKQMRTETGHRLLNYEGRCAHLHGHSYLWEVTVEGVLDHRGMAVDFKDLKKHMMTVIDPFDHALVLNEEDPLVGQECLVISTNNKAQRVIIFEGNPTAETFAKYAAKHIQREFNHNVVSLVDNTLRVVRVVVWETATSFATWEG